MKRAIKFYGWASYLINDDRSFEVQVEFDWDSERDKFDIMAPAFNALAKEMGKDKNLVQYDVSDWIWVQ